MLIPSPKYRWLGCLSVVLFLTAAVEAAERDELPFKSGDRIAWTGSSSTAMGVWPKAMEFLLRTRHPELKLVFRNYGKSGSTFDITRQELDGWCKNFQPTLVVFSYGGVDARSGKPGIDKFTESIDKCVAIAQDHGARVLFCTMQGIDARKAGAALTANRKLYAETHLAYAQEKQWRMVDVFHPLERLQAEAQKENDAFTINRDNVHLTDSAYIAWSYYLYDGLNPSPKTSLAELTATGNVTAATNCRITDVAASKSGLTFTRSDEILPILPPLALPPRQWVPLEKLSQYRLIVTDLPKGSYEVTAEGISVAKCTEAELTNGLNLNTRLVDASSVAPWDELARQLWDAKGLDRIGKTVWRFEVKKL